MAKLKVHTAVIIDMVLKRFMYLSFPPKFRGIEYPSCDSHNHKPNKTYASPQGGPLGAVLAK